MGTVEPFERRAVAALRERLSSELVERGSVVVEIDEIIVSVPQWRAAARSVGRQLGRPIRTGVHPSGSVVWAALDDWPATDDEHARHRIANASSRELADRTPLLADRVSSSLANNRAQAAERQEHRAHEHGHDDLIDRTLDWPVRKVAPLPGVTPEAIHSWCRLACS